MQNVSFRTLEEFFKHLPDNELQLIQYLRQIILDTIPYCREKLSYNVPYYYGNAAICFLWPCSVSWGNVTQEKPVRLGFPKGYLIKENTGYLEKGNRKQVYCKDFAKINEIDSDILRYILLEAVIIDNLISPKKKK